MSLRKQKAAILKLAVLDCAVKLIGKRSWADMLVDDICSKVKISKVTLFNYFPTKDEILAYYYRIWCFKRTVELQQKPREGVQGIYFLLDKWADSLEDNPGVVLGLCGYLAAMSRSAKPFIVKPEEKTMLYENIKGVENVEIQSLEIMIERFVLEALAKKEVSKNLPARDLTTLICSIFYGSAITANTGRVSSPKNYLRRNLDILLKGNQ
ncbi:MAG: hypothetical protein CRN43_19625 [Candidatus Nephrothrix sp. EaCA]|nr:MAG: hypothetical protein CRN43_19625 [Candidatus Nephrothrix sp. EaCA]